MFAFNCPNCGFSCQVPGYPVTCRCRARSEENGTWGVLPPVTETVVNLTCHHRGEAYRLEDCRTCKGKVQIKVFRCEKHGECQIEGYVEGVHVCDGNRL